jgi:hypothetical protein
VVQKRARGAEFFAQILFENLEGTPTSSTSMSPESAWNTVFDAKWVFSDRGSANSGFACDEELRRSNETLVLAQKWFPQLFENAMGEDGREARQERDEGAALHTGCRAKASRRKQLRSADVDEVGKEENVTKRRKVGHGRAVDVDKENTEKNGIKGAGVPKPKPLRMSVKSLKTGAKELGIPNSSRMSRIELKHAIAEAIPNMTISQMVDLCSRKRLRLDKPSRRAKKTDYTRLLCEHYGAIP